MNLPRIFPLNLVALLFVLPAAARAQQTVETTNRAGIKLSYIPAAKLNEVELHQVMSLARQVGITNVAEVCTDYSLPSSAKHVFVKSRERVNGRNISYERVKIERTGWGEGSKSERSLQSGNFWVEPCSKYTRLERTYAIGRITRRIALSEKDIPVADKAIPLIAAKNVRFRDEFVSLGFDRISLLQPAGLRKDNSSGHYELWLHTSQDVIHFLLENGEVLITAIGHYDI